MRNEVVALTTSHHQQQQQQQQPQSHTRPKVNNIKTHLCLTEEGRKRLLTNLKRLNIPVKRVYNFSVCRDLDPRRKGHVYIILEREGFLNITGIRDFASLEDVIPQLCLFFSLHPSDVATPQPLIDNISAAGIFNRRVDLNRLRETIKAKDPEASPPYFTITLNRNKFPGASCKAINGFGTITVFSTGKYVIVGPKCLASMDQVFLRMHALITTL